MKSSKSSRISHADKATFEIIGTVEKVCNGKQSDYATIRVEPDPLGYYDLYRVAVAKEVGIEPNDKVTCIGQLSTFFDRQNKTKKINFNATSVKPLE